MVPGGDIKISEQFNEIAIGQKVKNNGTEIHRDKPTTPPRDRKINIPVNKLWIVKDESTIADKTVEVKLLENGEFKGKTIKLTKANGWEGIFKDLPKYKEGTKEEIKYLVKEVKIDDYNVDISGGIENGFVVTNTKIKDPVEFMAMSIEKNWEDEKGNKLDKILDADGKEVKEIIVELTSTETGSKVRTITLKSADNWKFKIDKLPKIHKETGKKIQYSLKEIGKISGFKLKNIKENSDEAKFDFYLVNQRDIPVEEKINIPVEKIWKVKDESKIAAKVEVKLLENGEFNGRILELTKANGWKGEFENLPAKDATGKAIVYIIEEIDIPGFDKGKGGNQDTGFILINAERPLEPPVRTTTSVAVEKRWKVANEKTIENKEVEVRLLENGQFKGKLLRLNKSNGWKDQFANLPTRDGNGEFIKYDLEEVDMAGFYKDKTGNAEDGFILINSEKPTEPEKPVAPKPKDPIEPGRPREPEDPTEGIDQPDIPRGRGENPNEPNRPDGPKDPIKKTPKDKNANPQTYKPGSFRLIVELVLAMGIIFYLKIGVW